MFDRNTIAADLGALMSDLSDTITHGGRAYQCSRVSLRTEELRALRAEFSSDYSMTVAVIASHWQDSSPPVVGDIVVWDDDEYRVLATESDTLGIGIRLHLGLRNRGGGR